MEASLYMFPAPERKQPIRGFLYVGEEEEEEGEASLEKEVGGDGNESSPSRIGS